jgi:hypothetical protein
MSRVSRNRYRRRSWRRSKAFWLKEAANKKEEGANNRSVSKPPDNVEPYVKMDEARKQPKTE